MARLTDMTNPARQQVPTQQRSDHQLTIGVTTVRHAAAIAWRRARSFNALQPGPPTAVGVLLAPWLWPIELLGVAIESPRIHYLAGASATLTGGPQGRRSARLLIGVLGILIGIGIIVGAALTLTLRILLGVTDPATAELIALLLLTGPLLVEIARRVAKLRHQEVRGLGRRRRSLTAISGRPVQIMTSVVRTQPGEGAALLSAVGRRARTDDAVVIFNPANPHLAAYYQRHGARPDGTSWRRMIIDGAPADHPGT